MTSPTPVLPVERHTAMTDEQILKLWDEIWLEASSTSSVLRFARAILAAANKASALPLPEGWMAVPIEPTIEMLEAAWAEEVSMSDAHTEHGVTLHVWDAMLQAVPVQPEGGE